MKLKQEPTKEKILAALAFADNESVGDADYETIFDGVCRSNPIAYVCLAILASAYRKDQMHKQDEQIMKCSEAWHGVDADKFVDDLRSGELDLTKEKI